MPDPARAMTNSRPVTHVGKIQATKTASRTPYQNAWLLVTGPAVLAAYMLHKPGFPWASGNGLDGLAEVAGACRSFARPHVRGSLAAEAGATGASVLSAVTGSSAASPTSTLATRRARLPTGTPRPCPAPRRSTSSTCRTEIIRLAPPKSSSGRTFSALQVRRCQSRGLRSRSDRPEGPNMPACLRSVGSNGHVGCSRVSCGVRKQPDRPACTNRSAPGSPPKLPVTQPWPQSHAGARAAADPSCVVIRSAHSEDQSP